MSIAALIDDKIFCVNSGLPTYQSNLTYRIKNFGGPINTIVKLDEFAYEDRRCCKIEGNSYIDTPIIE